MSNEAVSWPTIHYGGASSAIWCDMAGKAHGKMRSMVKKDRGRAWPERPVSECGRRHPGCSMGENAGAEHGQARTRLQNTVNKAGAEHG